MEGIMEGATRRSALAAHRGNGWQRCAVCRDESIRHVQPSSYKGPIKLDGDPNGAKVLILGAGLAGMVAALELRSAGYDVEVLEYREKAGGRCWTLRGGDTYTELGGASQKVSFEGDNYINPGPWRIPYDHHGVLDYCQRLGVQLEPFIQQNHNGLYPQQQGVWRQAPTFQTHRHRLSWPDFGITGQGGRPGSSG
jgi:monoamine oxidase